MSQTILVVDDSPTVVKFVSFSLRNSGFTVVTACDGMDAIEKMSTLEGKVDLIITDLNMPNLDGYSLIQTVRQNDRTHATRRSSSCRRRKVMTTKPGGWRWAPVRIWSSRSSHRCF